MNEYINKLTISMLMVKKNIHVNNIKRHIILHMYIYMIIFNSLKYVLSKKKKTLKYVSYIFIIVVFDEITNMTLLEQYFFLRT